MPISCQVPSRERCRAKGRKPVESDRDAPRPAGPPGASGGCYPAPDSGSRGDRSRVPALRGFPVHYPLSDETTRSGRVAGRQGRRACSGKQPELGAGIGATRPRGVIEWRREPLPAREKFTMSPRPPWPVLRYDSHACACLERTTSFESHPATGTPRLCLRAVSWALRNQRAWLGARHGAAPTGSPCASRARSCSGSWPRRAARSRRTRSIGLS